MPLILFFFTGIFFCCNNCCSRFLDRMKERIFWNTYIRFSFEAFLELSISCMLRIESFSFSTGSNSFHSIFSLVIVIFLVGFTLFVTIYLQVNFRSLNEEAKRKKYEAMYLGLETRKRSALFSPVIFMLRRALYAGVLVYLVHRSYFQIQFMVLHSSLIVIYVGYFLPYELFF